MRPIPRSALGRKRSFSLSTAAQWVQFAYDHGVLEGSAGAEQVRPQITPGVVSGEVGTVIVKATWHSSSNYQLAPGKAVETEATGTFGDAELHLAGRFYLGRSLFLDDVELDPAARRFNRFIPGLFREGTVEGRVGERRITAEIAAASGGLSSSTVCAEGSWGDDRVALDGTVSGSLDAGGSDVRSGTAAWPCSSRVRTRA